MCHAIASIATLVAWIKESMTPYSKRQLSAHSHSSVVLLTLSLSLSQSFLISPCEFSFSLRWAGLTVPLSFQGIPSPLSFTPVLLALSLSTPEYLLRPFHHHTFHCNETPITCRQMHRDTHGTDDVWNCRCQAWVQAHSPCSIVQECSWWIAACTN